MQVRYNGAYSGTYSLPGGGPQGTLVGLIEYFVQSNDNADCVDPDLRFKFVDDLSILELVMLSFSLSNILNIMSLVTLASMSYISQQVACNHRTISTPSQTGQIKI